MIVLRYVLRSLGLLLALVVAGSVVSACTSSTTTDDTAPVEAAQRFVAALEARDPSAVLAMLEPTEWRKEIGPEIRSYVGYVERIEFQDPAYTLEDNDGEVAHVRLVATLDYALAQDAGAGTQPVDTVMEMAYVDNAWYVRSLDLPQPQPNS